jgi:hypothetical protein
MSVLLTVDNMKEKTLANAPSAMFTSAAIDLFAESSHADLYAAVNDLTDKLDRSIATKTKAQDPPPHRRQASSCLTLSPGKACPISLDGPDRLVFHRVGAKPLACSSGFLRHHR